MVLKQRIVLFIASIDVTPDKKGVGIWGLGEVSGDERKAGDEGMP